MKKRLDILLVEKGITDSRTKAAALIMAGNVYAADRILDKPGMQVDVDLELSIKNQPRFVSRAGEKLASVAEPFDLDFTGKTVLDVGSSTGGFTDLALQNGAAKVFAVDVGTNQLDYKLRQDPRVVVMEKTDIRSAVISDTIDIILIDVSFVSLTKILPSIVQFLKPAGQIVVMMKPQFEAGKELADKFRGVIKDEKIRQTVIQDFRAWLGDGFEIKNEADSAVAGSKGNIEHFFLLKKL